NSQIGPCGTDQSTADSQGIAISGNSSVNIYDSYIHVENQAATCDDSHDGIFISYNGTSQVNIQGNVIAFNQSNIRAYGSSNVTVAGNFLLNPRGSASCSGPDNLFGVQFQHW